MRFLWALAFVSVVGCRSEDPDRYPPLPAGARENDVRTTVQSLTVGATTYRADYGMIAVKERRESPTARLIAIPFLRLRSLAGEPAEPIFGLAGGPGTSNLSWDWGKAQPFLDRHDFVVVGYRGVDGAHRLSCPEVAEALKGCRDPLSRASLDTIGRAWTRSAERMKSEGVDLNGYTMLEVIEDMEAVRAALGYRRIDLLSESYGTRVAYLYGLRHPEAIARSAMISVNPPGHFVWDATTIDTQLRQYARLWSRDSLMTTRSADLYASMRRVLRSMPDHWLLFPIDAGRVRVVTFALLFQRGTAARVFDAYVAADQGDASGLALMSQAFNHVIPSLFTWGDLAAKAVSADIDSTRDDLAETESPETPLGSPMGRVLWGPLQFASWPTAPLPPEYRRIRESGVVTLLLSGNIDFSTPAEAARNELLPHLPNGRQVVLSECGHVDDVWYRNPGNTRRILNSFFDTGTADTSLTAYLPMEFQVDWGFPALAKTIVSAGVVIAVGLIVSIVWAFRRYVLRRPSGVTGTLS
jgi:pimeloyl-ACP methyl ester carboxylesterase